MATRNGNNFGAIIISGNTRLSAKSRQAVDALRTVRQVFDELNDALGQRSPSGQGTDWSFIESEFGLELGTGQDFYNLMTKVNDALNVNDVKKALKQLS